MSKELACFRPFLNFGDTLPPLACCKSASPHSGPRSIRSAQCSWCSLLSADISALLFLLVLALVSIPLAGIVYEVCM